MTKGNRFKSKKRISVYARVIGEKFFDADDFRIKNSDPAHRFAKKRKNSPTAAEKRFEQILNDFDNGSFVGKFEREWAICGKWILDFYIPEYRLAIEIDGSYHNSPKQSKKDAAKAADCEKLEIFLLRLTNREIFGDRGQLLGKLKDNLKIAALKADLCTKKTCISSNRKKVSSEKIVVQLTKREQNLIKRYFEFYKSLANGKRLPATAEQTHFVAVCQGSAAPETEHEIAFAKFIFIQSKNTKK